MIKRKPTRSSVTAVGSVVAQRIADASLTCHNLLQTDRKFSDVKRIEVVISRDDTYNDVLVGTRGLLLKPVAGFLKYFTGASPVPTVHITRPGQ